MRSETVLFLPPYAGMQIVGYAAERSLVHSSLGGLDPLMLQRNCEL